jgi:hypothetical protein
MTLTQICTLLNHRNHFSHEIHKSIYNYQSQSRKNNTRFNFTWLTENRFLEYMATRQSCQLLNKWFVCRWKSWFHGRGIVVFNISVISWQSVLLVEETGKQGENHRPTTNHWQTLKNNPIVVSISNKKNGRMCL